MRNELWDEIEGIGKIYMETELVVELETVLFVCINDEGHWLFMTYDSEGDCVFCKIEENTLLQRLNNKITMEEAYRKAEYIGETYIDEEDRMKYDRYEVAYFNGEKLPDKGAYYDIKSKYINDNISELQRYEKVGRTGKNRFTGEVREPIDKTYYTCKTYNRRGKNACTSHKLEARNLYNLVLKDIQGLPAMAMKDADAFYQRLCSQIESRYIVDASEMRKECDRLEARNQEIDDIF